jgi:mono/diheme cytochrome c family protein
MNPATVIRPNKTPSRLIQWLIPPDAICFGRHYSAVVSICLTVGLFCHLAARASQSAGHAEIDQVFTLKVFPLLKDKCFGCHGDDPEEIKGNLNLTTREGMLAGGENESAALVPGNSAQSPLYLSATWGNPDLEMPPKENDRLNPEQLQLLKNWIDQGASWPDASIQKQIREAQWNEPENADGILVKTSGGTSDAWTFRRYQPEDLWAFQPVEKPALPETNETAANPVDAFLDQKRLEKGFDPAPVANDRTLVRRVYFDLIGLPPTPAEMNRWLDTFAKFTDKSIPMGLLVDELLASPHYGERWAQHWLDVARYADTGGMSNDYERSNAWRYRDYVIRAFNDDKSYDQFIVEQLAGDELADASVLKRHNGDRPKVQSARLKGEYNSEEAEWIVATSFLRMGPWDNAMVKAPEARQMYLDDVVNAVGQTFLATTLRCVKCHDHKFDPIPTRDYYRIYAAFAGTHMAERHVPFTSEENLNGFEDGKKMVHTMLDFATREKQRILNKQEDAARAWYKARNKEYLTEEDRKDLPDEEKPPRMVGLNHVEQGQRKVREQDEWIWKRRLERYQPMVQSVYNAKEVTVAWNAARKLRITPLLQSAELVSYILQGGSLAAPGPKVQPGVLSAIKLPVKGASPDIPYVIGESIDGRRLALAKWIANPGNALTTRAIVNRIWQHHFNKPLAGNPNNFGAKGKKPTHPDLLDWLASDFVEHGWKIKRMHRLIMTSRAYRQSGQHPELEKLREADPDNALLAYYPSRRLSAEELRDSMLRITGEWNPTMGGLPIMPEMNMEVALAPRMIQFSLAPAYQPTPVPEARHRRSIYAYRVRGLADPFLEVFNQPNPNDSCEARNASSVSPQAFTLLNSDLTSDRSIAFARRLEEESNSLPEQIDRAFQLALGRSPETEEINRLSSYIKDMNEYHSKHTPKAVHYPTQITRSLVEEFSGKPFEYEEILPAYEHYQSNLKPSDVEPATRALADMCLVLLNANEFVYLY